MIRAENLAEPYQLAFHRGEQSGRADATADNGGGGQEFRPHELHELLEAVLASCMLMTLRMYAERHAIDHAGISVEVRLERTDPAHRRERMLQVAERCPVHRTRAASFEFRTV
jgi:putative redox protein